MKKKQRNLDLLSFETIDFRVFVDVFASAVGSKSLQTEVWVVSSWIWRGALRPAQKIRRCDSLSGSEHVVMDGQDLLDACAGEGLAGR